MLSDDGGSRSQTSWEPLLYIISIWLTLRTVSVLVNLISLFYLIFYQVALKPVWVTCPAGTDGFYRPLWVQGTYRHRTGLGRQYWCTVITSLKTTLRHPQCRHRSAFHHHHEPQPCSYTHREKRERNLKICDKCKIKITELSTLKNTNMGETCSPSTALSPWQIQTAFITKRSIVEKNKKFLTELHLYYSTTAGFWGWLHFCSLSCLLEWSSSQKHILTHCHWNFGT